MVYAVFHYVFDVFYKQPQVIYVISCLTLNLLAWRDDHKDRAYSTHSEKNDEPILPYRLYCYLDHPTCLVTSGGDPVIERDWSVIAVLPHNQSGRSLWHFLSSADRHLDGTKLLHSIT